MLVDLLKIRNERRIPWEGITDSEIQFTKSIESYTGRRFIYSVLAGDCEMPPSDIALKILGLISDELSVLTCSHYKSSIAQSCKLPVPSGNDVLERKAPYRKSPFFIRIPFYCYRVSPAELSL